MKKGFTLIEVTAVILLLALLTLITIPKIKSIIINKNQNAYEIMVNSIENAAKTYVYMNTIEVDNAIEEKGVYYIDILELKENELIGNSIINPLTKEEISNSDRVKIEKNGDKYSITYIGS